MSLYMQIKDEMMNKIKNREWVLGNRIPSENQLCKMYNVSRITVRQAIAELTRDGYLESRRGAGTYVTLPTLQNDADELYSIKNEIRKRGYHAWFKIIALNIEEPAEEDIRRLHLNPGEKVYSLERVIYADEIPMAYEINKLPVRLFPNLTIQQIEERNSLYSVISEEYGLSPTEAKEALSSSLADKHMAELLNVKRPFATLVIRRVTKQLEDYIEYSLCYVKGDLFWYGVKLKQL